MVSPFRLALALGVVLFACTEARGHLGLRGSGVSYDDDDEAILKALSAGASPYDDPDAKAANAKNQGPTPDPLLSNYRKEAEDTAQKVDNAPNVKATSTKVQAPTIDPLLSSWRASQGQEEKVKADSSQGGSSLKVDSAQAVEATSTKTEESAEAPTDPLLSAWKEESNGGEDEDQAILDRLNSGAAPSMGDSTDTSTPNADVSTLNVDESAQNSVAALAKGETETTETEKASGDKASADKAAAEQEATDKAEAAKQAIADKADADKQQEEADKAEADKEAAEQAEADKAEADKEASEQAAAEKAQADKEAAEHAAAEKAEAGKAEANKAAAGQQQAAEQAAADKAEADKGAAERAAADKAAEKAAAKRAAVRKAAADKAAAEKAAAVEKAAAEKVAVEKAAAEKAAVEKLAAVKNAAAAKTAIAQKAVAAKAAAVEKAAAKKAAVPEEVELARVAAVKAVVKKVLVGKVKKGLVGKYAREHSMKLARACVRACTPMVEREWCVKQCIRHGAKLRQHRAGPHKPVRALRRQAAQLFHVAQRRPTKAQVSSSRSRSLSEEAESRMARSQTEHFDLSEQLKSLEAYHATGSRTRVAHLAKRILPKKALNMNGFRWNDLKSDGLGEEGPRLERMHFAHQESEGDEELVRRFSMMHSDRHASEFQELEQSGADEEDVERSELQAEDDRSIEAIDNRIRAFAAEAGLVDTGSVIRSRMYQSRRYL